MTENFPEHWVQGAIDYRAERERREKANGKTPDYGCLSASGEPWVKPPPAPIEAFTFLGDVCATPPKMLIKGLLPVEGIAVTGGQSTAGKTFIEIHKAICLARALPFFGHKIVERVGTAFVAAEGGHSFPIASPLRWPRIRLQTNCRLRG